MARTTNFFGDLVETMYDNFEKEAAHVVNNVHRALVEESPIDTGTLVSNWKKGTAPHTKGDNRRPSNREKNAFYPPLFDDAKTFKIKKRYYVWNNTPYLYKVNSGEWPNNKHNMGFIERGIARGVAKAQGTI